MKYICYLSILLCSFHASAQSKYPAQKLYYFISDTTKRIGGVRNAKGDTILPAKYYLFAQENGEEITGLQFELFSIDSNTRNNDMGFGNDLMCFDRRGQFLYHPLVMDMAADFYENGLRRFTENGRLGFVNRFGVKLIPAQFNWATPFEHGLAAACYDCKNIVYDSTAEHGSFIQGNQWALIDLKGNVLQKGDSNFAKSLFRMPMDSISKALHILPDFSAEEQKLIARLKELPEVKQRFNEVKDINGVKTKIVLVPEVYERPMPIMVKAPPRFAPLSFDYCIAFVEKDAYGLNDFIFLISPDGKNIRHLDQDGQVLSLEAWRKQNAEVTAAE